MRRIDQPCAVSFCLSASSDCQPLSGPELHVARPVAWAASVGVTATMIMANFTRPSMEPPWGLADVEALPPGFFCPKGDLHTLAKYSLLGKIGARRERSKRPCPRTGMALV